MSAPGKFSTHDILGSVDPSQSLIPGCRSASFIHVSIIK